MDSLTDSSKEETSDLEEEARTTAHQGQGWKEAEEVSALEDAREFVEPWGEARLSDPRPVQIVRALIAEHERLTAEMHQRELHHFETEKAITEALRIDTHYMHPDARRVLTAALDSTKAPPSTDDERDLAQALFRTLYDAGVSFESNDLIPRLTATVLAAGFHRQGPITDDEREAPIPMLGEARVAADDLRNAAVEPWEIEACDKIREFLDAGIGRRPPLDDAIQQVRGWLDSPWTDTHSPDREWHQRLARLGLRGGRKVEAARDA